MFAGVAKTDITPTKNVWMDGMIRAHRSEGVHDPLYARAMALANSDDLASAYVVVSVDICGLRTEESLRVRQTASARCGIPAAQIIVAATHSHSGPATVGFLNDSEPEYTEELIDKLVTLIAGAAGRLQSVTIGCGSGREETISHYRRLLAKDGHVVMNWEPYPAEQIVGPLGVIDPEVGVLAARGKDGRMVGLLFNHAGHPNTLSGDSYLLSAEYPGLAERLLEAEFGGTAIFINGAQGTMDIDGLRDRDWEGMERIGKALAVAVSATVKGIDLAGLCDPLDRQRPARSESLRGGSIAYTVPARRITEAEWDWAQKILAQTGGKVQAMADGVGDDYKAVLYRNLRVVQRQQPDIALSQSCFAIGDCALLSFPGELYTEIGQAIKAASPFKHTYIIGLANGHIGYVPTRKAIHEGGYAEDTRGVDDAAEEIIVQKSLSLLRQVHAQVSRR
jgi:neutral ceramidase